MATAASKGKRAVVYISSSSDDDDEKEEKAEYVEEGDEASGSEFDSESDEEPESEDESCEEEPISEDESGSSNNDSEDVDELKGKLTDEKSCNKVIDLLRGRKSLNVLKLEECRAYLRKHELRISGTKETCITRILEHWRIKDGNGEKLYPESSFVINCTGDVCRGDVVKFKLRVYEKFNKIKRGGSGKIIGTRIVVGRVVTESYGAGKQQHTFSIDVLWSKGVKALPPLFPLLVKGRNLYRMKTFRQPWPNESERSRVLAEKHIRGAAARHIRAIAKAVAAKRAGSKHKKNSSTAKATPNKKSKKDLELAAEKKHNFLKKPRASTTQREAKMRKTGKQKNLGSSSTHNNTKLWELAYTRNPGSSYQHPEQYGYQPIHRESYSNYSKTPVEAFDSNYNGISWLNQRMHQISTHNMVSSSSTAGPGMSHAHMMHGYNTGHASYAYDPISSRDRYVTHPHDGNPLFQLDLRRQVVFDDRVSGHQFYGWRRS